MKREVVFEEKPYGSVWMTDICGGSNYIIESFEGGDGTGTRYFRLDGNGVSFFCMQGNDNKKLYTVYDIVVCDDVSTLDMFRALDDKPGNDYSLQYMLPFCEDIVIDIEGNGRTYPSVEVLGIGSVVSDIRVRNSQFPSVNEIRSPGGDGRFCSVFNRCLLKETMRGKSYTLLNIFGPSDPNGHYYYSNLMSRINEIADYAMADASIWFLTALGRNSSIKLNEHSLDGCLDAVYDKNGILAAYGLIIDVAPGVSSVEIGNGRYTHINTALLGDKIQRVIIDTYLFPENAAGFAGAIADLVSEFSDKAEFVLNITNPLTNVSPSFFMALRNCAFEKITVSYGGYVMKDNVVYTTDGETLVCGWNATGNISIPEGVETIATAAFLKSRVASVSLPKSLKEIGSYAFMDAGNLRDINLPDGLVQISDSAFEWTGIREISIPKSCENVGENALDCADVIKAYPGGDMGISCTFMSRDRADVVVIENAETGKRYAFVGASDSRIVAERVFAEQMEEIDTAWRGNDMDAFERVAGNLYSCVSLRHFDARAYLTVFAFINGYASENTKAYAKKLAFDFILRRIKSGDEKLAIEAVKADGLLKRSELKKLLPAASSAGMVEAATAISERIQPKTKRAAKAISL
jgi:hypothetical protein